MMASWLGVPTVFELHSIPIQPTQRRFLPLLAKAPGLRRVVVISQALHQVIEAEYPSIARRPIVVAHDAVDIARFAIPESREEARRQLGLPEAVTIVGYTGRLSPGKGVHTLLAAARGASFTTCIVGGNPDDPSDLLYKYREEYQSPEIIFVGHQPPAKIPLYLRAFDIVVAPFTREPVSQFTVKGKALAYDISGVMSPLKIFEYMASSTPMVVSDLPVLREVLVPGETAVMIPPADPQALGQALHQLIQDTSRANGLSERAREMVHSYTWEARAWNIFAGL
jgi:glycosyltransferase involved in cell wall biosynthesis